MSQGNWGYIRIHGHHTRRLKTHASVSWFGLPQMRHWDVVTEVLRISVDIYDLQYRPQKRANYTFTVTGRKMRENLILLPQLKEHLLMRMVIAFRCQIKNRLRCPIDQWELVIDQTVKQLSYYYYLMSLLWVLRAVFIIMNSITLFWETHNNDWEAPGNNTQMI